MLIIACIFTLFAILFITRLMVKPIEKEQPPPPQLSPTSFSKRLPARLLVINNETPWYMKKLDDTKK